MSDDIQFSRDPTGGPGEVVELTPLVRRIVAGNGGPFTYTGTCTYIVGRGQVAVIDPGPDVEAHRRSILDAVRGETVTHILVTHTHRDHSPGVPALKAATGAAVTGCGPHRRSRALVEGEDGTESSGDLAYRPDREMADGDAVSGPGWTLRAVATPGHAANHLAFLFPEENALFSGDHVMAWSTTIVAPPEGSMGDYMRSLRKLRDIEAGIYWPGHGGPVRDPARFVRALTHHRLQREAAILARLGPEPTAIPALVAAIYVGLAPALTRAAGLSVFAHLEDLVARGLVASEGPPRLDSRFVRRPA